MTGVRSEGGLVWHRTTLPLATGQDVRGRVDWPRRYQLMKYHTLLHIVNTVMLDRHQALITGADIGPAQARIDFDVDAPLREARGAIEAAVNAVIERSLALVAAFVPETELTRNPRLVRTLEVSPPVENGRSSWAGVEGRRAARRVTGVSRLLRRPALRPGCRARHARRPRSPRDRRGHRGPRSGGSGTTPRCRAVRRPGGDSRMRHT